MLTNRHLNLIRRAAPNQINCRNFRSNFPFYSFCIINVKSARRNRENEFFLKPLNSERGEMTQVGLVLHWLIIYNSLSAN